jgi:hypothetical protein
MRASRLGLLAAFFLGLAAGCGEPSQTPSRVTGMVKYNGQPVPSGTITFHSEDKGPYSAVLAEDGTYEIADLPSGKMVVTVECETFNTNRNLPAYGGARGNAMTNERLEAERQAGRTINPGTERKYVKIPAKYAKPATSGLTATLETGRQTKIFELTD